ncbi:MAG TPA: TA system VapC family ribonuclease toxin [Ilumatobacter sp.]|nr:TA system VapC family ribonuclease toxin [Ilumatobacter sp.]
MIVDANLLLYASDATSPFHARSAAWLIDTLDGDVAVGLPWQTLGAFVRIATNPRITTTPLTGLRAWEQVERWLAADATWIPPATGATARIYGELARRVEITANLVPDAMLAALAIENGVEVASADADFARFPGVRWHNPLTA